MSGKLKQKETEIRVNKKCVEKNCILINDFIYKTSETTILSLKCNVCNYIWTPTYCGFVTSNTGCPNCGGTKKLTKEEIIIRINKRCIEENYKLNSKFIYIDKNSKIELLCSMNHVFQTTYFSFINQKSGCLICRNIELHNKQRLTLNKVNENIKQRCIEENCILIDDFIYHNNQTKFNLKCLKCDNIWDVYYMNFVNSKSGCPKCKKASQLENNIQILLEKNNIKYIRQYSNVFIGKKTLDFYLPDYKIGIECQGKQHFTPNSFGYDKSEKNKNLLFQKIIENDKIKFFECKSNGISIIYFANENYQDNEEFHQINNHYYKNIFTSEIELINKINENGK